LSFDWAGSSDSCISETAVFAVCGVVGAGAAARIIRIAKMAMATIVGANLVFFIL
jgi:hypothetical protein